MAEVEIPKPDELEEMKSSAFTRRVALTTAAYAVMLAIAALGGNNAMKEMILAQQQARGNNAMKEMILAQQQASDQWAYYQAKVVREHQYRIQQKRLEVELAERRASLSPDIAQQYEALLGEFSAEARRYNTEKKDLEREAKQFEQERDLNRNKDPYFDFAEVLLQIAIVLASISILSSSRLMFGVSLVLAVCGTFLTVNGYTLWIRLPFFHAGH